MSLTTMSPAILVLQAVAEHVRQNGQAVAAVAAPDAMTSSVRRWLIR